MTGRDAMALAAELASAWPGRAIGELTLSQYAKALKSTSRAIGVLAVGDLVRAFPDRPPTLGQLNEAIRLREREHQPELPSAHEDIGYSRDVTDSDYLAHGRFHLRELLEIPRDKRPENLRDIAQHPELCECEKRLDAETLAEDIVKRWR